MAIVEMAWLTDAAWNRVAGVTFVPLARLLVPKPAAHAIL